MLDIGTVLSPSLPRLAPWLPLVWRRPSELQVGCGPDAGLVLSGVPDGIEPLLRLVDGRHTRRDLRTRATAYGIEPAVVDQILDILGAAGLLLPASAGRALVDPVGPVDLGRLRIRLIGAGALGSAVGHALVGAGVGRLYLADNDPVDPGVHPRPGLAGRQSEALAAELTGPRAALGAAERNRPGRPRPPVQVVDHWTKPDHPDVDLTVVATDYAEPDPAMGRDLVDAGLRHLYLRPLLGGAVVGPFVHPGRTPCLRCLDLTRRDADPAWPTLLPQLCRTRLPVVPLLASWAAATALTQIAAACPADREPAEDTLPSTAVGTVEMTAADCEVQYRRWPVHPGCHCHW